MEDPKNPVLLKKQKREERIAKLLHKGFTVNQVIQKTGYRECEVVPIARHARQKQAIKNVEKAVKEEIFKDKVPALKEIVGSTLLQVKKAIEELNDPEIRSKMIRSIADVKNLAAIATDLNTLLRLELGQATENIQVAQFSYQQTRVVLQELAKKDPVFEYPQLPEPAK